MTQLPAASPPPDPAAPVPGRPLSRPTRRESGPSSVLVTFAAAALLTAGLTLLLLAMLPALGADVAPAARSLLVVTLTGLLIVWPMVRLSFRPPRDPAALALSDTLTLIPGLNLLLWPLGLLAAWPPRTVLAVIALLGAWTVLVGGLIALALQSLTPARRGLRHAVRRAAWMAAILFGSVGAPAAGLALSAASVTAPPWLRLASPFTALALLTGPGWAAPPNRAPALFWPVLVVTL
ncbi:MAG TPA: hypothetical protein VD963_09455, partial [Phycisphaerales bacterium]|nr:hypothetical protein [Phycisphaerales bacterium]